MSELPLIYAIQAVVLLHSPNLHVFSELHLALSRSKNVRTKCQIVLKYCLYNVQAVICTLVRSYENHDPHFVKLLLA